MRSWIVLLSVMSLFVACGGESPVADESDGDSSGVQERREGGIPEDTANAMPTPLPSTAAADVPVDDLEQELDTLDEDDEFDEELADLEKDLDLSDI